MTQLLRSTLFHALFYPATLLFVIAGLAASVVSQDLARSVVHRWSAVHHWLVTRLLGIRIRIDGMVPPGPFLIAVKHQSMLETVEILRIADTPVVVLKRELSDLPLFGWMTQRYGTIPVDRQAGARALRAMTARGREAIAQGRPIVIFPEGTRVPVGSRPPLRPGFAGLYRALGLPVVPIAVDSGRLWTRGWVKRAGTVTFMIGEKIPPGLKRDAVELRVHRAINALEPSS